MRGVFYFFIIFLTALLSACTDNGSILNIADVSSRPIATVYKVNTTAIDYAPIECRRAPVATADVMIRLYNGSLVDLVAIEEGMLKRDNTYWLHVYPPLSHRPSCYIDVRYLVPYA
ncbi:MAG TPA: hypothetical protein PLM98_08630 [Thiolinea sp.]|nr:hypothetical protein [Thiolinea sp.]